VLFYNTALAGHPYLRMYTWMGTYAGKSSYKMRAFSYCKGCFLTDWQHESSLAALRGRRTNAGQDLPPQVINHFKKM